MPILSPSDAARVREMLASLPNPVRLVFFTQTLNCDTCEPTRQILGELAGLSGQITVEEHNFLLEAEAAAAYRTTACRPSPRRGTSHAQFLQMGGDSVVADRHSRWRWCGSRRSGQRSGGRFDFCRCSNASRAGTGTRPARQPQGAHQGHHQRGRSDLSAASG